MLIDTFRKFLFVPWVKIASLLQRPAKYVERPDQVPLPRTVVNVTELSLFVHQRAPKVDSLIASVSIGLASMWTLGERPQRRSPSVAVDRVASRQSLPS
jgi:hypothetical protein